MRISTLAAIAAVPFVAAAAVDHRPHAAVHRRRQHMQMEERQILGGILSDLFGGGDKETSTEPVLPSTSKPGVVVPTSSDHATGPSTTPPVNPPVTSSHANSSPPPSAASSTSVAPPSSTSAASSASPPPSSTATSSVTPSPSPPPPQTTDAPSSTEEQSTAPPPSSTEPAMSFKTEENGQVVTVYLTASTSERATSAAAAKSDGGLSSGAKVGIIVASVIVGLILLVGALFLGFRKRRTDDEPMRWPELNRHGDSAAHVAVPVSRSSGHDERRMSLGDELDGPTYLGDVDARDIPALNGSSFGQAAMLDYDEKANHVGATGYEPDYPPHQPTPQQGYGFDDPHSDYTSYPPPVQPQPSPVHGAPYDWEGSSSEHGYTGMTRQTSPTMQMAGVGAGGMTFPQPQAPSHHY